ncbi:hypothetical protein M407DRAFT_163167 [Tulasnella calospora MUT 4182]|uniref:Uncharacterized protein n=1 Tax=Tulasnella calospora MUT 4182 TaxID=1051891 RepID=A0A0C3QQA0_9AGAM|nr:hypothetical protein M407DRAFT_163167 [Tulasnella calospora MUT 4182]
MTGRTEGSYTLFGASGIAGTPAPAARAQQAIRTLSTDNQPSWGSVSRDSRHTFQGSRYFLHIVFRFTREHMPLLPWTHQMIRHERSLAKRGGQGRLWHGKPSAP